MCYIYVTRRGFALTPLLTSTYNDKYLKSIIDIWASRGYNEDMENNNVIVYCDACDDEIGTFASKDMVPNRSLACGPICEDCFEIQTEWLVGLEDN